MSSTAIRRAPTGLWPPRQEVQRGPGAGLRGGRVCGDVRGREPHLWHHRTRPGADPRLVLERRCQAHQGHVQAAHPEGLGAHGAPRLGLPHPQPRSGPHHPRPGAPRRQRRGDADERGRSGRPLLFQLELELELIQSDMAQKPMLWGEVFSTTPRGGVTPLPRRAQPLLLLDWTT